MSDERPTPRQIPVTTELLMAWVFRAMVALVTFVGLPTAGYLLMSLMSKADDVVTTVHAHDTKLELLSLGNQMINSKLNDFHDSLQDHEKRIRELERPQGTGHQ